MLTEGIFLALVGRVCVIIDETVTGIRVIGREHFVKRGDKGLST
jgi:hypothetical protein